VVTSIFNGELTWLPEIGYGWQGSWRGRLAVSQSVRLARALTVGSQFAGRDLGRRPWHWVPLGVDERLFTDVPSAPQGPPWRLLHIAHINPVKDQGTLLRAVRMVADKRPVRLDWFGQDTLDGRLQELTKALDLDALVRFHGFRPLDELIPYYRQAHLLLQSSRYESQGVAVCEAAALGVPTVGTAVGLVAELAPQAAMAVAVGDASGLAEAVLGLLADRSEREMLGAAARRWAWHHHAGWTADQFEKIYDDCLRNG
jgi:glycosyltransferase involved in cell wall biosynthesis